MKYLTFVWGDVTYVVHALHGCRYDSDDFGRGRDRRYECHRF